MRSISPHAALLACALLAACGPAPARLPAEVEVTLRGHYELTLDERGLPLPLFLESEGKPPGLCLIAPLSLDLSSWRGRFAWRERAPTAGTANVEQSLAREEWRAPDLMLSGPGTARRAIDRSSAVAPSDFAVAPSDFAVACFDQPLPAGIGQRADLELCGEVSPAGGAGRPPYRLPCRRLVYEPNPARYRAIWAEGCAPDASPAARARASAEAAEAGYPLLRVFIDLLRVDRLRRTRDPEDLAEAKRLLAAMPPILAAPEASDHAGQVMLQRSLVALADQRFKSAWGHLQAADGAFLRVGSPLRLSVLQQQAEILRQVGAPAAAQRALRRGLASAGDSLPWLRAAAAEELAWMLLIDPSSGREALDEAEELLDIAEGLARGDEANEERANRWLNRAFLNQRRGNSIAPPLAEARGLLESAGDAGRTPYLRRFMTWLEGQSALERGGGDVEVARERCLRLLEEAELGRTVAWAAACVGRAKRLGGSLDAARDAFAVALAAYEGLSPLGLGQSIPPSPGRRADVYFRAARLYVDLGEPEEAWRTLDRLDRLAAQEEARRRCLETTDDPGLRTLWASRQATIDRQLKELAALEGPAGSEERRRRAIRRRALHESLQRSARTLPECGDLPEIPRREPTNSSPLWRAFALEEETLLLHRGPEGRVRVAARQPVRRAEIAALLGRLEAAQRSGDPVTVRRWREALEPVASALLPEDLAELGSSPTFSLHGVLQRVPLTALPIKVGGEDAWLAELTTPNLRPAGDRNPAAIAAASEPAPGPALFVVDPRGDLGWADGLADEYRRSFPEATHLRRGLARVDSVRRALRGARWIHFDAHGRYDEAFPENSGLQLADGVITVDQLTFGPRPASFANLSGCATGRWPATADSGRYGLGGLLARRGVSWVIATTDAVGDRLMSDFNQSLYGGLAAGQEIPTAYRHALESVRRLGHPVSDWSRLMLLRGSDAPDAREKPRLATPSQTEGVGGESTG
ncbi:MAG: CHAT domain-containing protein [Acidobacteriota bacterium]